MTKSIDFRNLFIIMILKSLYYSDNFSLSILSSIRRIDSRRFLLVYFVCRLIFENNWRKFWLQNQLIFETFSSLWVWNLYIVLTTIISFKFVSSRRVDHWRFVRLKFNLYVCLLFLWYLNNSIYITWFTKLSL